MANMILKARTDIVGSECEVDMGVTQEEWSAMSETEQQDLINEYKSNVMELWVEVEDSQGEDGVQSELKQTEING